MSQVISMTNVNVGDIVLITDSSSTINLSSRIGMVTSKTGVTCLVTLVNGVITEATSVEVIISYAEIIDAFTKKGVELVERAENR